MAKTYGNMTPLTRDEVEFDHMNLIRAVVANCSIEQVNVILNDVIKARPARCVAAPQEYNGTHAYPDEN